MHGSRSMLMCLPALLAAAGAPAQSPAPRHFHVESLGPGVWAAIASDTGSAIGNAGIVDLGDAALVFDAFLTPEAAEELRGVAEALTGGPVRYLVLSHFHNDHIRGAQAFPDAEILATGAIREKIREQEPREIEWEKQNAPARLGDVRAQLAAERDPERRRELTMWAVYYETMLRSHPQLRLTLPGIAFQGRLTLHGSERRVELLDVGRGHSESDIVLHLPQERIAFLGDLLFVERHPYLPDGYPDEWKRVLAQVHGLGVQRVVPGHGPVGGAAALTDMIRYIKTLEGLAAELARRGIPADAAAKQPVPDEYRRWWFSMFFPANLRFLHGRAAAGTPPL